MHQDMYVKALALYLLILVTAAYHQPLNFSGMKAPGGGSTSFIALPVDGNVYPKGYYTVTISIGSQNSYVLDVDTGSDITWVKCVGQGVQSPYYSPDPRVERGCINIYCSHLECKALGDYRTSKCDFNDEACEYTVRYADGDSCSGVLFKDSFHFILSNGIKVTPQLAFGCGYLNGHSVHNGGVLGLGKGAPGILKQLGNQGVISDVVGHCLSSTGGGFIFLGNYDNLPSSIVWKQQLSPNSIHYSLGSADLLIDSNRLLGKGLQIIFDSGSTYTYFNSNSYFVAVYGIYLKLRGIPGRPVNHDKGDKTLPVCWKGRQPFGSIMDAAKYFPNLVLRFVGAANVQLYLNPKHYLIISDRGNACLGILNGTQVGLGNMNVIGDISMQDKLVVYDNENARVGWAGVPSYSLT